METESEGDTERDREMDSEKKNTVTSSHHTSKRRVVQVWCILYPNNQKNKEWHEWENKPRLPLFSATRHFWTRSRIRIDHRVGMNLCISFGIVFLDLPVIHITAGTVLVHPGEEGNGGTHYRTQ